MKNQKGFSLVELLVVVIIIAIIAAIAIPNLLASRRAANQASAVNNLRTIHSANVTYFSVNGNNNTYGDLGDLQAAGLIDPSWADGVTKATYVFTATTGTQTYCAVANNADTAYIDYAVDQAGTVFQGTADFTCTGGTRGGGGTVTVVGTTPAPAP